jgi:hypothetical protein
MPNVFIDPAPDGHFFIEHENGTRHVPHFPTQQAAIDHAKSMGYHPLVARVRHLNDGKIPDHCSASIMH